MKRIVILIIAAAVVGKIFAAELVRLAENSSTTSKNLGRDLYLEKATNDQLKLNHVQSNLDMVRRFPKRTFAFNKPMPHATPATSLVSKVTKTDEKAKEDAKKDKERRKERQKNLEEKANQTAQNKPQTPAPFIFPPTPPPDYNTSYAALPLPAGVGTPLSNTNPNAVTAPETPVLPVHVSTLSNNAAISGWIKLLTTNPSAAAMTSFESQFDTKAITQGEYYQVLAAMQSSSNVESRNFAVQGAAHYQNISSFKVLADESKNETDPTVRGLATQDLTPYDNAANIALLTSASTSGDPAEKAVANAFLQVIAGANPTQPTSSTTTSPVFHL